MQWERSQRWKEFWHRTEQEDATEDEEEEETASIFKNKTQKTNLPRRHSPPQDLTACLAATKYDVIGSHIKKVQPNIPPDVRAAGRDLITLQKERVLVIKPTDKTGGVCLMDFGDYKASMDTKMEESFVDIDGVEKKKYVKTSEKYLKIQWKAVRDIVEERGQLDILQGMMLD